MSEDVYREIILDHYRHPRNYGTIQNPDFKAKDSNPLCGDVVEIQAVVQDGRIKEAKFVGQGCAISQASTSMLTEMIVGKSLDEVRQMDKQHIIEALGDPQLGPVRIKCALLSLKVLKLGLYSYLEQEMGNSKQEES